MPSLAIGEARRIFSEILNRVAYAGERITIDRRGKPIAAMIPIEDLELLEALEDRLDLADARAAIAEMEETGEGPVTLKAFRDQLGL